MFVAPGIGSVQLLSDQNMDPKIILVLAWAIIHSVLTHSTTYCKAKASGLELNEPPILRFFLANVAATEAMKAKWSDRL